MLTDVWLPVGHDDAQTGPGASPVNYPKALIVIDLVAQILSRLLPTHFTASASGDVHKMRPRLKHHAKQGVRYFVQWQSKTSALISLHGCLWHRIKNDADGGRVSPARSGSGWPDQPS